MDQLDQIKKGSIKLPPYVYSERPDTADALCQGDVLRVTGQLRLHFKRFYPSIRQSPFDTRFAMVLTQTCDLVPRSTAGRKLPSALHVSLCPVRPIERALQFELEQLGKSKTAGFFLLESDAFEALQGKVSRLVNNSESKHLFFLPRNKDEFPNHSVAILSLGYSFRRELYPELLKNRVLSLKPDFRAKVGFLLADYYGRVATDDLLDPLGDEALLWISSNLLRRAKILNGHSGQAIQRVKARKPKDVSEIEAAVKEFLLEERLKEIKARKKKVSKFYSQKAFELIRDQLKLQALQGMSDMQLRQELASLSDGIDEHLV